MQFHKMARFSLNIKYNMAFTLKCKFTCIPGWLKLGKKTANMSNIFLQLCKRVQLVIIYLGVIFMFNDNHSHGTERTAEDST